MKNEMSHVSNQLCEDLKIPKCYVKEFEKSDRVIAAVNQLWLRNLKNGSLNEFVKHEAHSENEIQAKVVLHEPLGPTWTQILITMIPKSERRVVPLPRQRTLSQSSEEELTYSQFLQYISLTNHKNLWKETFKKFNARFMPFLDSKELSSSISLIHHDTAVRDVVTRTYGCPIIRLHLSPVVSTNVPSYEPHPNVLPAYVALETNSFFYILQETLNFNSLQDCVNYSPAILSENYYKPLFICYQLLHVMRDMHDRGLALGDITLSDILIQNNLWIQVIPKLTDNIYDPPKVASKEQATSKRTPNSVSGDLSNRSSYHEKTDSLDLTLYCEQWVQGVIGNYEYLTVLNKLAGRRIGDPRSHYVFPWVTDFTSRSGQNWRDLTRSKYRLNKGDRQLDITYDLPASFADDQIPHHVSDILSEITYYVYLARITPKSVLCKHVRPQWVPAEYPVSIQRLQQWTPDECIPEFFTDPTIFKSVHNDLPDLEIPSWANSPQDFINCHRAALESTYVSERLHHWIDLTFGYKLSGSAAIKAKNVCLQLVDNHTTIASQGVMQLFSLPHPQKHLPSPYLSKTPPRIFKPKAYIDEDDHSSGPEDTESHGHASLGASKYLSRSRNSLNNVSPSNTEGTLYLPQGYNPIQSLVAFESTYTFVTKTCNKSKVTLQGNRIIDNERNMSTQYKQVVATRRAQEILVFGCILVELFMASKLRAVGSNLHVPCFKRRLENCRAALCARRDDVPRCIRSVVTMILQTENLSAAQASAGIRTYPVTDFGIPPPSAHQLLIANLSSYLLPIPVSFPGLYATLRSDREYVTLVAEVLTLMDAREAQTGTCPESITFALRTIDERRVIELARRMQTLDDVGVILSSSRWLDFVVPLVLEMLACRRTSVMAAWYLLDPVARILGPQVSAKLLLKPTIKLYEFEEIESRFFDHTYYDAKRIKLYHRSFLLRLIVRFGLKTFLDNIVTFLIEAVGGYHDFDNNRCSSDINPVQRLNEISNFLHSLDDSVAAKNGPKQKTSAMDENVQLEFENQNNLVIEEKKEAESEDLESDTDNLTSLHEMLLDEREVASDDDRDFVEELQLDDVQMNGKPSHDSIDLPTNTFNQAEKGINESCKIAEMSMESVIWLAHRLGPVLTAKYITRNLLRMLTLCYTGDVHADEKSTHVIQCLINIAGLYGEQFVLIQYIPQIADLIVVCKKSKITQALEGGFVGYISLFKYIITFLSNDTLKDLMDVISKTVLHPAIRLMSSTKILFPSGSSSRTLIASKLIDCLYILGMRQGHLISRSLQRFFLTFDKLRLSDNEEFSECTKTNKHVNMTSEEKSGFSDSPDTSQPACGSQSFQEKEQFRTKVMEELCNVLTPELAYEAYSIFARYFGESFMQTSLVNLNFIQQLCAIYKEERQLYGYSKSDLKEGVKVLEEYDGTQATVSGNRIHFPESTIENVDECKEALDESRHLCGNWLAYWEYEAGRSLSDHKFNFKQIKLQTFVGHSNTIKSLHVLDNENSFISGSRDKTVKLWSLRSQGDGNAMVQCQYTYTHHHKSVLSIGFCERTRLVASCDSVVHLWDPFMGRLVSVVRDGYPVNALVPLGAPHATLIAANTHASLHVLDTRTASFVSELKVCVNATGLIRSVAVSPSSNWVAVGQSSGVMAVLDLRTGSIVQSWKGHDGEVLQIVAANEDTLVTSSLDQSLSVWNITEGKLIFNMKGAVEPVHCLAKFYDELISGTTANRIGVYTSIGNDASFSSIKLRSDTFKGVLTTMAVLPLNKLLLLGADTGFITLIC